VITNVVISGATQQTKEIFQNCQGTSNAIGAFPQHDRTSGIVFENRNNKVKFAGGSETIENSSTAGYVEFSRVNDFDCLRDSTELR
jgi:hypothetical protein